MTILYRRIFKNKDLGVETLKELLQTMFVGELLDNGNAIWIVSPWISNVTLIDNRSGNYNLINPEWSYKEVKLSDILLTLMNRGVKVFVVTRDDKTNNAFITKVKFDVEKYNCSDNLVIKIDNTEHTKGILLSNCYLSGSMNLTYMGININGESIDFSIDQNDIAQARINFESRFL